MVIYGDVVAAQEVPVALTSDGTRTYVLPEFVRGPRSSASVTTKVLFTDGGSGRQISSVNCEFSPPLIRRRGAPRLSASGGHAGELPSDDRFISAQPFTDVYRVAIFTCAFVDGGIGPAEAAVARRNAQEPIAFAAAGTYDPEAAAVPPTARQPLPVKPAEPSPAVAPRLPPPSPIAPDRAEGSSPPQYRAARPRSTGSGFAVDRTGRLVTNQHVVRSCSYVAIRTDRGSQVAMVEAADPILDLALVRAPTVTANPVSIRTRPIALGEDATVFGFPLSHLLAKTVGLTKGVVSATAGLASDAMRFQISSPVQPGNSGGPIVDSGGLVIGVVVSTLDSISAARATGAIPQNVNFGIRAEALRLFLGAHNVRFITEESAPHRPTSEVAQAIARSVMLVECYE